MVKSYCVKQKQQTKCIEPSGYQRAKNGRLIVIVPNVVSRKSHLSRKDRETNWPSHGAGVLSDEIFKGLAKSAYTLGKHGLSQAIRSPWAKREVRLSSPGWFRSKDVWRKTKLGELHMKTPTWKKYNYCGPGTKLDEWLSSGDPKGREPINNLDAICQQYDTDCSNAESPSDKHVADRVML